MLMWPLTFVQHDTSFWLLPVAHWNDHSARAEFASHKRLPEGCSGNFGEKDWRPLRGDKIGFVLQDALVSLDPLRRISLPLSAERSSPRTTKS